MNETPRVYLNHLLIFVDRDTYTAIAASAFLREELAWWETRTTVDEENQASWIGCYLYGGRTYFEFMNPVATTWKPRDGIAFGVETPGAGQALSVRLSQRLKREVRHYLRYRQYRDRTVPWFYMIEYDRAQKAQMVSWIMEYHPEFLQRWEPHRSPTEGGITRSDVLDRYRACLGAGGKDTLDRYFRDIREVRVVLPGDEARLFREEVEGYGYRIHEKAARFTCEGPDILIRVEPGDPPHTGIHEFTMTLHRPKTGPQAYRFGSQGVLTFHNDQTAVWRFW